MSMRIRRESPEATVATCRKCREVVYRCADPSCDRGGWYSVPNPNHQGDGRHECYAPGELTSSPHVPE